MKVFLDLCLVVHLVVQLVWYLVWKYLVKDFVIVLQRSFFFIFGQYVFDKKRCDILIIQLRY